MTSDSSLPLDLVERFIQSENAHDVEAMDSLFAPEARFWGNGVLVQDTWAGYRAIVVGTLAAFPDSHRTRLQTAADGDVVAFRWRVTGTHAAPWNGVPPSGKPVEFNGSSWVRVQHGRIVEAWFDMDLAGPIRQMTAT